MFISSVPNGPEPFYWPRQGGGKVENSGRVGTGGEVGNKQGVGTQGHTYTKRKPITAQHNNQIRNIQFALNTVFECPTRTVFTC
jgi:hypothetical protein